ncbi:centrosomal protein of 126 kDa-like, partial [Brachionichthys hirsutus]|uniref:centrosomal protein of 126 kDa-like n=1 Tax=Brachionichthys hirsutus TaxID=412623 RepID=UPI00360463CA
MSAPRQDQPAKMKVPQDNFIKHSRSRSGDEGGLEDERRRLFEEQKLSRARGRRMTMETNRRRRALEERQSEWNMQQNQMRENILLQRRHRIQDATERFQRAHLPPSQRYRHDFRRNVPNVEDALNQIQGKLSSAKQQSYFLPSNSNTTRRCTSSAKPPTPFKSSHRQTLSAVEISSKPILEQSMTPFNICQQTKKSPEKQQDHSPQDNNLFAPSDSDSISSKDSLEYEQPACSTQNLQSFHPSFLLGREEPFPALERIKQNYLCPTTDLTSFSEMTLHADNLPPSRKLHEAKQQMQEDSQWSNNQLQTSKASWGFPSVEQMPGQTDLSVFINNLNKPKIENPINTVSQQRACYEGSTNLAGKSVNIASQEHPRYAVSTELQTEKSDHTESPQHTCLYNIQAGTPKCPEKDVQQLPVSAGASHSILQVRFAKGILKQQSQNMSGSHMCVCGSGPLTFPEQVALAIRDSVEIAKAKTKGSESSSVLKKKLHWFDEEHEEDEDEDRTQDRKRRMNSTSFRLHQSSNDPEDQRESHTVVSCASKPGHDMTLPASTGIRFTRQATADVGGRVSFPQQPAEEVEVPCSSNRANGPHVPQRACSARVGAVPVSSSRTRRGTVLRPVSAAEMNAIAKTHGKIIAPRPPPNKKLLKGQTTNVIKFPYHFSANSEPAPALEQAAHKHHSEDLFSQDTLIDIKTVPGGNTQKSKCTSAHQETQSCTRRSRVVDFKTGLRLDCTPTDEEISQLWQDVRSVLSTKEGNVCSIFEKNKLRREAVESEQIVRKPKVKPSTQTPGSGHKNFPQPSQPTRLMSEPVLSRFYRKAFPDEGLKSATQLHLAREHAEGFSEEKDITVAMEMQQTHRPGKVQQNCNRRGLSTISIEEEKILLSLDRLDHKLHYVQDYMGVHNGLARDMKIPNHHKHSASPSNNRAGYKKK